MQAPYAICASTVATEFHNQPNDLRQAFLHERAFGQPNGQLKSFNHFRSPKSNIGQVNGHLAKGAVCRDVSCSDDRLWRPGPSSSSSEFDGRPDVRTHYLSTLTVLELVEGRFSAAFLDALLLRCATVCQCPVPVR